MSESASKCVHVREPKLQNNKISFVKINTKTHNSHTHTHTLVHKSHENATRYKNEIDNKIITMTMMTTATATVAAKWIQIIFLLSTMQAMWFSV